MEQLFVAIFISIVFLLCDMNLYECFTSRPHIFLGLLVLHVSSEPFLLDSYVSTIIT